MTATLFRDPSVLVALSALLVFVAGGFLAWRAKSGEIWEQVADGYKEQVAQREETITELRGQLTEVRAEVAALREQVETFKGRDQAAVLAALRDHEVQAGQRADRTLELLARAVDALEGQTP